MDGNGMDEVWRGAIVAQSRRWLLAYVVVQVGNPQDAEDIVQQVFLRAYANRQKYDSAQAFGGWLRGIARNVVREHWRRRNRLPVLAQEECLDVLEQAAARDEGFWGEPDYEERRRKALQDCVGRLTQRAQRILRCKYMESLKSKAIGVRLGMTGTAVDMALSRARRFLLDCVTARLGQAAE